MSAGKNPQMNETRHLLRKPPWLKVRPACTDKCRQIRKTLSSLQLHTVCQEAACPNMAECFQKGTATFLILGNVCTRNCLYCNISHGIPPQKVNENEIEHLISAVGQMKLRYVVLTSVTRDDLPDGGAETFARCITGLRQAIPDCKIEVLIPDFRGNIKSLEKVIDAKPDVINHNLEVVAPLFPLLRPQGNYQRSLALLSSVAPTPIITKSGFMVGFGEDKADIFRLMDDLSSISCQRLTIGQYQQPTLKHWPVAKYYSPEEFDEFQTIALSRGFANIQSGPLVRSSYHASLPDEPAGISTNQQRL